MAEINGKGKKCSSITEFEVRGRESTVAGLLPRGEMGTVVWQKVFEGI